MNRSDDPTADAASMAGVVIERVTTIDATIEALSVIAQVWGPEGARDADLYFVVANHGGYLSIARRGVLAVGASFGFLSNGGRGLHSHMTGVIPGQLGGGVGRALKFDQRAWCAERGIEEITWTFDPLVRRNAWFNLVRLGARIVGYFPNHYGTLTDDLNAGEETDRVEVSWSVGDATSMAPAEPVSGDLVVPTPADIEALRRTDRAAAAVWRASVRDALHPALAAGHVVSGVTADGSYVVSPPASGQRHHAGPGEGSS